MLEQWFTPSLMAEPELKMLLRTLMSVFPYTVVFAQLDWSNYVAVGSLQPIHLDLDVLRGWWRRPRIADHLRSIGVESPEELLSYLVAGQERLWEYVGRDGPVVTDDHTYVDFVIPRSGAAGFGFGIYNPAQRAPFLRRQAEDWAVVDRLQAAEPLGPLLRSADGAASFQEQVDRLRAMRRLARVDELPWARVGVHAEADRPEN
jgi:hypothetical protein